MTKPTNAKTEGEQLKDLLAAVGEVAAAQRAMAHAQYAINVEPYEPLVKGRTTPLSAEERAKRLNHLERLANAWRSESGLL